MDTNTDLTPPTLKGGDSHFTEARTGAQGMTTEKMTDNVLAEQKAAQYLIVVYRTEDTPDGLIRSVIHAKFGPAQWEKALQMLAEANKMKKADPNLYVNLTRV